jgi:exodeoxyribonuclease V alpha subunit
MVWIWPTPYASPRLTAPRPLRGQENPYHQVLDRHGIGFKTADTLAQCPSIPRKAMIRARAGVQHVLQTFAGEGYCAVIQAVLIEAAVTLLEISGTT